MFRIFIFIFVIGIFVGCKPTTKVVGSLTKENLEPKKYKKIAILAILPRNESRAVLENAVSDNFLLKTVPAIPTYDIFPFANNIEVIDEVTQDMSKEEIEQNIIDNIKRNNIDALMIITLLDAQQEDRYIPSSGYSGYYYMPGYDPVYTYTYYGYYGYAYTSARRPGFYQRKTTFFLESNLYDIDDEGLIWTGQTMTKDPRSILGEADLIAQLLVNQVIEKQVIKVNEF